MIRHILVPLDGSAVAESILPYVQELAAGTGARVTLLGVVDPLAPHDEVVVSGPVDIRGELWGAAAYLHDYLGGVAGRLARAGVAAQARVVTGAVAEQIIETARTVDLIAMTTHGRGGLDRLMHGSVADQVVRHATVPVLLVRPVVPATEPARLPAIVGAAP